MVVQPCGRWKASWFRVKEHEDGRENILKLELRRLLYRACLAEAEVNVGAFAMSRMQRPPF